MLSRRFRIALLTSSARRCRRIGPPETIPTYRRVSPCLGSRFGTHDPCRPQQGRHAETATGMHGRCKSGRRREKGVHMGRRTGRVLGLDRGCEREWCERVVVLQTGGLQKSRDFLALRVCTYFKSCSGLQTLRLSTVLSTARMHQQIQTLLQIHQTLQK